ncbi:MAG: hypothetical protein GXY37_09645 [Chloroflexi bacterium]|nr:hypothetical protein [Chloroflexota bacterium]
MQYLIDGHNLIPHFRGLSLSDPDDEEALLELLSRFQRVQRASITVFFDGTPLGKHGTRRYGSVNAVFVPANKTADQAIAETLARHKAAAKNIVLVSSDRQVQATGRERRSTVMQSSKFARLVLNAIQSTDAQSGEIEASSADEIEEWLRIFSDPKNKKTSS